MTNTAKVRKTYTIQARTPSGWRLAGFSKQAMAGQMATALNRLRGFAENNPGTTFRLIDSTGSILAVRAPAS
jgi:hypothetical protein